MNQKEQQQRKQIIQTKTMLRKLLKRRKRNDYPFYMFLMDNRKRFTVYIEFGHSYSFVRYGEIKIYHDRIEIEKDENLEIARALLLYKSDMLIAIIPFMDKGNDK